MSTMSTSSRRTIFFQSLSVCSQPQRSANAFSDSWCRPQATFSTGFASRSKNSGACRHALEWALPMNL